MTRTYGYLSTPGDEKVVLQLAIERDTAEPFDTFHYAFEWITWAYAQKLKKRRKVEFVPVLPESFN